MRYRVRQASQDGEWSYWQQDFPTREAAATAVDKFIAQSSKSNRRWLRQEIQIIEETE